jgi:hypothetical protein
MPEEWGMSGFIRIGCTAEKESCDVPTLHVFVRREAACER